MSDKSSDKWEANPIWRKVVVIPARRCLRGPARAPALPALSCLHAGGGAGQKDGWEEGWLGRGRRAGGERIVADRRDSCGICNRSLAVYSKQEVYFFSVFCLFFFLCVIRGEETKDE